MWRQRSLASAVPAAQRKSRRDVPGQGALLLHGRGLQGQLGDGVTGGSGQGLGGAHQHPLRCGQGASVR